MYFRYFADNSVVIIYLSLYVVSDLCKIKQITQKLKLFKYNQSKRVVSLLKCHNQYFLSITPLSFLLLVPCFFKSVNFLFYLFFWIKLTYSHYIGSENVKTALNELSFNKKFHFHFAVKKNRNKLQYISRKK